MTARLGRDSDEMYNNSSVVRIGRKTVLLALLFWYGLGCLNPQIYLVSDVTPALLAIASFAISYVLGDLTISRSAWHSKPRPLRVANKIHFMRIWLAIAGLLSFFIFATIFANGSMIHYHSIRSLSAAGILAVASAFLFNGRRRILLLISAAAISLMASGFYSRRTLLTIVGAFVIVGISQSNRRIVRYISIYGTVAALSLMLITGLRHQEPGDWNPITAISNGYNLIAQGAGFDTILLTQYVIDRYDMSNYLMGKSFAAGFLNPIPRSLWPGKPIAFGILLSAEYFGVSPDQVFTNFGPGIVAELLANGGYVALLAGGFLCGCLVALFDRYIDREPDVFWRSLMGALAYPALFFIVRGDFVNGFYELYSKIVLTGVSLYVVRMWSISGSLSIRWSTARQVR